jgi:hypothetical protein
MRSIQGRRLTQGRLRQRSRGTTAIDSISSQGSCTQVAVSRAAAVLGPDQQFNLSAAALHQTSQARDRETQNILTTRTSSSTQATVVRIVHPQHQQQAVTDVPRTLPSIYTTNRRGASQMTMKSQLCSLATNREAKEALGRCVPRSTSVSVCSSSGGIHSHDCIACRSGS